MATKKKATVSKASPKKTPSGQASKSSSVKAADAKKTAPKKAQKAAGKKAVVKAAPEKAPKATVAPKAKAKPASKTKVAPKATPAPKASGATKPKSTPKPKPTKAPPASVARALAELDDDPDVDELHHEEAEEASPDLWRLDRLLRGFLRRLEQRSDFHVPAEIGESGCHDLLAAVMTVLAHLRDHDAWTAARDLLERGRSGACPVDRLVRARGGQIDALQRADLGLVPAPDLFQRKADLAHCGAGAGCIDG